MDYLIVAQMAEKWGVSPRRVHKYLQEGRIQGATRFGSTWMIPAYAEKPGDPRFEKKSHKNYLSAEFNYILEHTIVPTPRDNPDAILDTVAEPRIRLQMESELAYLHGDFTRVIERYHMTEGDAASRLRATPVTIAAAISSGNYPLYLEIETFLKDIVSTNINTGLSTFAELSLATAHTGAVAPDMAPKWLQTGDFSALHPLVRPDAVYKRAKYFQCIGEYKSMLDICQTALTFCASERGITFHDIYFRVACAIACVGLSRADEAKHWLMDAMNIALPHGFITPFAESATAFGGLLGKLLSLEYPKHHDAVMAQWERTYTNWFSFHNRFTKDNITLILTLREYEIAQAAAHRVTYAEIAKQHSVSLSRLKGLMEIIYGKLLISGRKELAEYVF